MTETLKPYREQLDEELMSAVQSGREVAFNELYQRYGGRLYRYFYRMLGQDPEKASDFTQDLFMKLIERPEAFDTGRKFSTWFFAVAANMIKNEYRRIGRQPGTSALPEEVPAAAPDQKLFQQIDAPVERAYIEKAVGMLSPSHREVFLLRYQEGLDIKEISSIIGCPEGTVKSRLYYGLQKLNQQLRSVLR